MTELKVLAVASEVAPLVKTGGLADVAGALPLALKAEGVATRTLVPGYPAVLAKLERAEIVHDFIELFGGPATLLAAEASGLDLFVLDAPHLYARPGGPYVDEEGKDYADNAFRFAALAKAGSAIGRGLLESFRPDILHAHDWQAGLAPAYLHYSGGPRPGALFTIHNIAFQGKFQKSILDDLGLPPHSFALEGVEYYGGVGFLKAGLQFADRITTVSPSYAVEITTAEFGMGLEGLLRARAGVLSGILNGVDENVWNPAADARIAAPFGASSLAARVKNKSALQRRLGLKEDERAFLIGAVSRLSWQKGLDLLLEDLSFFIERNAQLALLGAGDRELENAFAAAARVHAGRIGVQLGYDEDLAHLIQAGCDAFLVPSRFEPCGLTQLYALRYGAVPIVARVGGLRDTIIDANEMALAAGVATGFQFSPVTADALSFALRKAAGLFEGEAAWRVLQANGMKTDVSWRGPARKYAELYRSVIAEEPR
ncbi:MAG: glycogen synthase GlgA [Methylocystaceae bacterium]|nr:MAG: glycogen synthase GlgA [Methylocystaceae bacterium]